MYKTCYYVTKLTIDLKLTHSVRILIYDQCFPIHSLQGNAVMNFFAGILKLQLAGSHPLPFKRLNVKTATV